jgi:hypothetical protein
MNITLKQAVRALSLAAALSFAAVSHAAAGIEPVAKVVYQPLSLAWEPQVEFRSASLTIVGPDGYRFEHDFGAAKPSFTLSTEPKLADGQYTYEVNFGRKPDAALEKAMAQARFDDGGSASDPSLASRIAALRATMSGAFRVEGGRIVSPALVEPRVPMVVAKDFVGAPKDVVNPDDFIVQGDLCVGFDCINGENFGFDTLRIKGNNNRIQFYDTSTSVGFANNNWQIRANDAGSSTASYLAFVDQGVDGSSDTGNIVFSVAAGAPSNSLYVSNIGRIGVRTATPGLDVHIHSSNTPAVRLEQDNASGFTAQTWDIGANEANFFVRDLTGGSRLPFRIRPGAPTSSIDIGAGGNVGIGAATNGPPTAEAGSPYLFVGKRFSIGTSASAGDQYVQLSNNATFDGSAPHYMDDGPANQVYMNGDTTVFRRAASGAKNDPIAWSESMRIDAAGRVGIGGVPAAAEASSPYLFVGSRFSIGTSAVAGPNYVQLSNNAIFDGANPTYVGDGGVGQMYMNGDTIVFRRAPSGTAGSVVPWSESLRIDASGVRVNGNLHVTGTCCTPDYVFDPSFRLASIDDNAAYMWRHHHLPALPAAKTTADGRAEIDVFAQSKGMLEELEKAHIYIEQLHERIKSLEGEVQAAKTAQAARDHELREELAAIRALVQR